MKKALIVVGIVAALIIAVAIVLQRQSKRREAEQERQKTELASKIDAEFRPRLDAAAQSVRTLIATLPDPSVVKGQAQPYPMTSLAIPDHPTAGDIPRYVNWKPEAAGDMEIVDYSELMKELGQPVAAEDSVLLGDGVMPAETEGPLFGCGTKLNAILTHSSAASGLLQTEAEMRSYYQDLEKLRFLVINRPRTYVKPSETSAPDGREKKDGTFSAGTIEGVVYVIDLSKSAMVIAFHVRAVNNAEISFTSEQNMAWARGALAPIKDLRDNMISAVRFSVGKYD